MKFTEWLWNIISAFWMAIIFVSPIFVEDIIVDKSIVLELVYLVLSAVMFGFLLISRTKKIWGLKLFLFVPLSCLVIQYFWKTNYAIRGLNWVHPDYGRQSAGGAFVWFFFFRIQVLLYLIAAVVALMAKPKIDKTFERIHVIISTLFTLILVVIILLMERNFPDMASIFGG